MFSGRRIYLSNLSARCGILRNKGELFFDLLFFVLFLNLSFPNRGHHHKNWFLFLLSFKSGNFIKLMLYFWCKLRFDWRFLGRRRFSGCVYWWKFESLGLEWLLFTKLSLELLQFFINVIVFLLSSINSLTHVILL